MMLLLMSSSCHWLGIIMICVFRPHPSSFYTVPTVMILSFLLISPLYSLFLIPLLPILHFSSRCWRVGGTMSLWDRYRRELIKNGLLNDLTSESLCMMRKSSNVCLSQIERISFCSKISGIWRWHLVCHSLRQPLSYLPHATVLTEHLSSSITHPSNTIPRRPLTLLWWSSMAFGSQSA